MATILIMKKKFKTRRLFEYHKMAEETRKKQSLKRQLNIYSEFSLLRHFKLTKHFFTTTSNSRERESKNNITIHWHLIYFFFVQLKLVKFLIYVLCCVLHLLNINSQQLGKNWSKQNHRTNKFTFLHRK